MRVQRPRSHTVRGSVKEWMGRTLPALVRLPLPLPLLCMPVIWWWVRNNNPNHWLGWGVVEGPLVSSNATCWDAACAFERVALSSSSSLSSWDEPFPDPDWEQDIVVTTTTTKRRRRGQPRPQEEPQRQRHARVTCYAPRTFERLRGHFGVTSFRQYRRSIRMPYVSFQSNSKGAARSGGIFFFTRDGKFLVKTVKKAEAWTLLKLLPAYTRFMTEHSKESLLTQFFGLYRVLLYNGTKTNHTSQRQRRQGPTEEHYFVVMNSIFPANTAKRIMARFDLKGSTNRGRKCSPEERFRKGRNAVLKDLDFVDVSDHCVLETIPEEQQQQKKKKNQTKPNEASFRWGQQFQRDVDFLRRSQVMDYSLLVGVATSNSTWTFMTRHRRRRRKGNGDSHSHIPSCVPGRWYGRPATYYLGLIDFLQPWTMAKQWERNFKSLLLLVTGKDSVRTISCVDPDFYAYRFLQFVQTYLLH